MESVKEMRRKKLCLRYVPEMEPIKLVTRTAIETHNFVRVPYKIERVQTSLGHRKYLDTGISFSNHYAKQKSFNRSVNRNEETSFCSIE